MKIRSLYTIICLMPVVLFSCSDNIDLKAKDLEKYPWLVPFIQADIKDFKGKHNMDLGTLEFSFQESAQTNGLSQFDSVVQEEQWEFIKQSQLEREVSKNVAEDHMNGETVMKVRLDTLKHRLYFRIN
jgi:hypothetical protein